MLLLRLVCLPQVPLLSVLCAVLTCSPAGAWWHDQVPHQEEEVEGKEAGGEEALWQHLTTLQN